MCIRVRCVTAPPGNTSPHGQGYCQSTHLISPVHPQFLLSWIDKVWNGIVDVKLRLLSEALSLGLLGEGGAGEELEYPA